MAGRGETDAALLARSIIVSRVIDAPSELVFEAWTDAKHLTEWWGPTGFTTTTHSFDMRVGGVWNFIMHGPDGRNYPNHITFDEIERPKMIAFHHDDPLNPGRVHHRTTVRFEDVEGRTRVTLDMVFPSAEERERVAREHGAVEGGNQTLGRLAEYAEREAAAKC
ncbi:MAG: SRPBCC family protein [Rhizomicrobium sp.]